LAYEIYAFDYDIESDWFQNRRVFAHFSESDGMPDGLTIDADGGLGLHSGEEVELCRCSQNGEVDRKIDVPVPKTSSLTFAGHGYRDLLGYDGGWQC
jgi:sugar lactone lactonase YvrE